jgi:DNA modification methylase
VNTGRSFIGMELDEGYFEIAKKRVQEALERVKEDDE